MTLIMNIMTTIATPIGELALWLEETYQVSINETIGKWEELTGMKITVSENEISHNEVESMTSVVDAKKLNKKIPKTKTKDTCQHTFLSGQKVGEQCTTKPKNGAVFCSAHKPKDKDSIKSNSSAAKKSSKKKEIKQMDKIDPEFESDSDKEEKVVKATDEKKKKKVVTPKKSAKKVSGDTDLENSDDEIPVMSEPEEIAKPLLLKKKVVPAKKSTKKVSGDTDLENSNDEIQPPETEEEELLKLKKKKKSSVKKNKKNYNTDEEHIDKDLNLSDEE
jgi:hypothetical protein